MRYVHGVVVEVVNYAGDVDDVGAVDDLGLVGVGGGLAGGGEGGEEVEDGLLSGGEAFGEC